MVPEQEHRYEQWQAELRQLLLDEEGDEYVSHRITCLRADILGYQLAQQAWERGDEQMAQNPFERDLSPYDG